MRLKMPNTTVTTAGYVDFAAKINREFLTRHQGFANCEQGQVVA
jgi:hypothetical protein